MHVDKKEIDSYLEEVKKLIQDDKYRIEINSRRLDNIKLFTDYIIDEQKAKNILLDLNSDDFCEILKNDHIGFEDELLYVFGKDIQLLERIGDKEKTVSLYIKFNKLGNYFVVVISIHESKYPNKYYFK